MNNALFRAALTAEGEQKLVVVGYGFGDGHINEAIIEGIEQGLRLWIIDPRSPTELRDHYLKGCPEIFAAIAGYSPISFDHLIGDDFYLRILRGDFLVEP